MPRRGICGIGLQSLDGIATEIMDDPEKLFGIRIDREIRGDAVVKLDTAVGIERQNVAYVPHQKAQLHHLAFRRAFGRLAIG